MKHILTRLSLAALMLGTTVGCAVSQISGTSDNKSVLYVNAVGAKFDDGGDFEMGGGIGWRHENPIHYYRVEANYAETEDGNGISADTWQALIEASGKITPGVIGTPPSNGKKGSTFVMTPFGGGGGRYVSTDPNVSGEDTSVGNIYGHLGLDFSWWFSGQTRLYVNLRGGASIWSYVDETVAGTSNSESTFFGGGNYRGELGFEVNHFHISAFYDFADFGEDVELTMTGLNIGYRW